MDFYGINKKKESSSRWYKIVYSTGENSPNFEENVEGTSAANAIQSLRYYKEKIGKKIKILYVWECVNQSEYEENTDWCRNVQYLRVEFPTLEDKEQNEETKALVKAIEQYMSQRFLSHAFTPRDGHFTVCSDGFMRADENFDNIDLKGECDNYPTRGEEENRP